MDNRQNVFYAPYHRQGLWAGRWPMAHSFPAQPPYPPTAGPATIMSAWAPNTLATPSSAWNPWPLARIRMQTPVARGSFAHHPQSLSFPAQPNTAIQRPRPLITPSSARHQGRQYQRPYQPPSFQSLLNPPRRPRVGHINLDHSRSTRSGILGIGHTPLKKWSIRRRAQADPFPRAQSDEGGAPFDQDAKSEKLYQQIMERLAHWKEKYPDSFWDRMAEPYLVSPWSIGPTNTAGGLEGGVSARNLGADSTAGCSTSYLVQADDEYVTVRGPKENPFGAVGTPLPKRSRPACAETVLRPPSESTRVFEGQTILY